jgi:hypothetical protein
MHVYKLSELGEMTDIIVKLSLDILFEYTDNENAVIWFDSNKRYTENKLNFNNIGFNGGTEISF